MNLSKTILTLMLPLGAFALPLGLGNAAAQPLALLLLMPFLLYCREGLVRTAPFLLVVVAVSIIQVYAHSLDYSGYQFLRSGVPFAFLCIILAGYREASFRASARLDMLGAGAGPAIDKLFILFALGQFVQVALYSLGVDLGNTASVSEAGDRILLFPTTATVLLFFYACCRRSLLLLGMLSAVLLASGSKTIIAAMLAVGIISMLYIKVPRKVIGLAASGGLALILTAFLNPLPFERAAGFVLEEQGQDTTRLYEIAHAKESFTSNLGTVMVGKGLAVPLTPGVATNDARWFENSKYDIENAYWALLAKIGILGCLYLLVLLLRMPYDSVTWAAFSILLIFGMKTSYQYFTTFDGCFLLLCSILVRYRLHLLAGGPVISSPSGVPGQHEFAALRAGSKGVKSA